MILNVPYLYLKEDTAGKCYYVYVSILLHDYKFDTARITDSNIDLNTVPNGEPPSWRPLDESPRRLTSRHPYENSKLKRSRIKINLEPSSGHSQLWTRCFKLEYKDIDFPNPTRADFVQVLTIKNDAHQHHTGSSVGHYGDAD